MSSFIKILFVSCVIQLIIIWSGFALYGFDLNGLQNALRLSGKFSLLIFTFLFLQTALSPSKVFGLQTREWSAVFAAVHLIHLVCILFFITSEKFDIIPSRLAGGALAYSLIFLLPVLYFSGKTVKNWFRNTCLYYISFVFFMTYLPRVQGKMPDASGSHEEYVFGISYILLLTLIGSVLFFIGRKSKKLVKI